MNGSEGYGREDFEYDTEDSEDTEDTEDTEADESWEAADEADEGADEMAMEADEGADEADESTTIGASEADEAVDEADEAADEAVYMSASARLRANEDRQRREQWARRIAADQRLEAQRAAAAHRAIRERIRAIPITRRTRVASVGSLQGAGVVTAILPNGRRSRMRIIPTVAPISEVNRLRSVVIANEKRQAAAIATNAKAVTALATTQASALKRLTDAQVKSDKELSRRLVQGDNRLDARITKELSAGGGIIDKHNKRLVRVLKRERRRAMMNNVLLATSVPFFLAYGDRETPFTVDNAIITGSTLFWLLGDDVLSAWVSNKGYMQNVASIWSYAAPVANGGGLYWWFRNKQNQRFVAGITTVTGGSTDVDVAALIKKDGVDTFNSNDHAVVASFAEAGGTGTVHAELGTDGILTLTIVGGTSTGTDTGSTSSGTSAKVAWIVDTKKPTEVAKR